MQRVRLAWLVAISLMPAGSLAAHSHAWGLAHAAPRWQFAVLPFLGFALLKHLERLFVGDPVVGAALEPTFLVGLSLQIPFAVAALLAARVLSRAATWLGRALREVSPRRFPAGTSTTPRPGDILMPRLPPLALGSCGRGPPLCSRP